MTELADGVAMWNMEDRYDRALWFANVQAKVRVLDREEEVSSGTEGELCIRGPNVAEGYLQNPAATEKAFAKDVWLKTGDVATIDESRKPNVLARVQDLIKVDGQKIIPLHIERVLLSHPEVQEAVVYAVQETENGTFEQARIDGVHDPPNGTLKETRRPLVHEPPNAPPKDPQSNGIHSGSPKIRAYIFKTKTSALTDQDIHNFVAQKALVMKGVSGGVVFLDSIPKTTVGLDLSRVLQRDGRVMGLMRNIEA